MEGVSPSPDAGRTDPIVTGCPVCNATLPCLYDVLSDPLEVCTPARLSARPGRMLYATIATCCILRVAYCMPRMLHVACCMLHVACRMLVLQAHNRAAEPELAAVVERLTHALAGFVEPCVLGDSR